MEMFARGLSTRVIEAAFTDATGASVLSRTAVSQVTERLVAGVRGLCQPGPQRVRRGLLLRRWGGGAAARRASSGAVLCAWGITEDGRKVLLHLAPGTEEDATRGRTSARNRLPRHREPHSRCCLPANPQECCLQRLPLRLPNCSLRAGAGGSPPGSGFRNLQNGCSGNSVKEIRVDSGSVQQPVRRTRR